MRILFGLLMAGAVWGQSFEVVFDRTGLTGVYEIDLDYRFFPADTTKPDIFDAIQDQLGLRLEPIKAPGDVIVIDHIERPSEN